MPAKREVQEVRAAQLSLGGERVLILVRGLTDFEVRNVLRDLSPKQAVLAAAVREYWEDFNLRLLGPL